LANIQCNILENDFKPIIAPMAKRLNFKKACVKISEFAEVIPSLN
jgi:hypothetical protein